MIGFALLLCSACGSAVVDCGDYEAKLRLLSSPSVLQDAGVTTLASRRNEWLIAATDGQDTRLVSLDKRTRTPTDRGAISPPLALVGLGARAVLLTGAALEYIEPDFSTVSLLGPTDGTQGFWIAENESSLSLINSGRTAKPTVIEFAQGKTEPTILFEGLAGPDSFSAIARNESTTCAIAFDRTSGRDEIRCRGSGSEFSITPEVAPLSSSNGRRTLAMSPTQVFWIGQTGQIHSAVLKEDGRQGVTQVTGRISSLQSTLCGMLVSRTEGDSVLLTYFGNSIFDLVTGLISEPRLVGNELTYVRDGTAIIHTF